MKLAEYATQHRCPVCALDDAIQQELQDAYATGVRFAVMIRWLREFHQVSVFYEKIKNHFNNRHYERTAKP